MTLAEQEQPVGMDTLLAGASDSEVRAHELGLRAAQIMQTAYEEGGDEDQLSEARREAAEPFGEVVDLMKWRVKRIVRNRSDDPDLVDDIVQNTYYNTWKGVHTFKAEGLFVAWLCSSAAREVRNFQTTRAHQTMQKAVKVGDSSLFEKLTEEMSVDPAEIVTERMRLLEALEQVPEQPLTIFLMHTQLGMKPSEIAEVLDMKPNAISAALTRVRKTVREEYEIDELYEGGYVDDPRLRPTRSQLANGVKPLIGKAREQALERARAARVTALQSALAQN